jgi:hypothetical protein
MRVAFSIREALAATIWTAPLEIKSGQGDTLWNCFSRLDKTMTDGDTGRSRQHAPGAEKLGAFARQLGDLLADRLAAHAARGNGTLSPRDVQAILNGFDYAKDPAVRDLCEQAWSRFHQDFESAFYARMRKYPLERLVVARFSSLLPDRDADPVPGKTLSRRAIPAFIQALHQMVGPELFEEYENRARDMVDAIQAKEGSADWENLPNHPVARVLVNDILIYIARYFTDVPKRRQWMVGFFDRTMPQPKTETEKAWTFGDMEFHKLMSALFRDLAEAMYDPEARQRLESRYDAASLSQLEQILAGLAQDQRRVMG